MTLKVYYDLMSQPSRAVWMFVKINNIPFEDCPVALRKGEHKTDEYARINPFQKVPAIDHDGFKLTESVAILKYLATVFHVPDHWYPKDIKKRARVDEYMSWQHLNLRSFGSMYFQTKIIAPLLTQKPVDEVKLARWKRDLDVTLGQMQQVWLKKGAYINGADDVTVADLLAACELEQPICAGYDLTKDYPIIKTYLQHIRNRLAPFYDDAHKVAWRLRDANLRANL